MARKNNSLKRVKTDETTIETLVAIAVVVGLFILLGLLDVGQVVSENIFDASPSIEPVVKETSSNNIEIKLASAVAEIVIEEKAPIAEKATSVLTSGTTLGSSSSEFDVM